MALVIQERLGVLGVIPPQQNTERRAGSVVSWNYTETMVIANGTVSPTYALAVLRYV